mgnify:CR=1 FL=1
MVIEDTLERQISRARFLVIHNPNAGRAARKLYHATLDELQKLGAHLKVVETTRHGDGVAAAAQAAISGRFDAVLAAGGDGTIHDVAEGLVGHTTPLGIIPTGTANVFAREIGVPRTPVELAHLLVDGHVSSIPVGQANGRPFLFVVGVGFDAEAVRLFETEGSREWGQAGFVWPVLRALVAHRDQPLRVTTERGESEAHWIIVTRVKRFAASLLLTPEADLLQPRIYILRFRGPGALQRLHQLAALTLGLVRYDPTIDIETATWVRIEGDRAIPAHIDGELLGELPLEIGLHPKQLNVIVATAP